MAGVRLGDTTLDALTLCCALEKGDAFPGVDLDARCSGRGSGDARRRRLAHRQVTSPPSPEGTVSRLAPPTILLTAAILLAGCATDKIATAPDAAVGAKTKVPPTLNFGALVERFTGGFEISWDPARDVTWTLGLINPLSDLCDPTADLEFDDSGSFLSVTTPKGVRHISSNTGGRVTFALYSGTPPTNICNAELLATGQVASTTNDNDTFLTGTGTNSFGRRVSGIVTLTDGTRAQLLIVGRALIHQDQFDDDPIIPVFVVDRFELRPIGQP